jgi:hypothetical protein
MSAPEYLTWKGDTAAGIAPYRPGSDDLGGDELVDDEDEAPIEGEMPTSAGHNQQVKQIVAIGRVASAAKVYVTFPGGVPTISGVAAPNESVATTDFTPTDNNAGDTTLTVAANKLPARIVPPKVTLVHDAAAITNPRWVTVEVVSANVIRVRSYQGTTLTDFPFVVDWD